MIRKAALAIAATASLCVSFVACGGSFSSGSPGSGDAGSTGGTAGGSGGGAAGGRASGGAKGAGGSPGAGGQPGAGGAPSSGGSPTAGGAPSSGGSPNAGGAPSSGGSPGSGGAPSSGGSPGSGGAPSSGGSPGSGGLKGSGGSGGGGGSCNQTTCGAYFTCCGNRCANTANDPQNCGSCDHPCPVDKPFCSGGQCGTPPCTPPPGAGVCAPSSVCCGTTCCGSGQTCCSVTANFTTLGCYDGDTCPLGCPLCVCASPDTPIATPDGERAIASLRVGDRVLSVDHGRVVEVPLVEVHRSPAFHHHVVRVELANGSVLEISAPHPTADGRTFADLRAKDALGGVRIERVSVVPYSSSFTYDILPASDSGTYFAGGVLIGSTLGGAALSSGAGDYAKMTFSGTAVSSPGPESP